MSSPVASPVNVRHDVGSVPSILEVGGEGEKVQGDNLEAQELISPRYVPMQNNGVGRGSSSKNYGDQVNFNSYMEKVAADQTLVDPPNKNVLDAVLENIRHKEGLSGSGPSLDGRANLKNMFGLSNEGVRPKRSKVPSILKSKKGRGGQKSDLSPIENDRPKKRPRSELEERFDLNKEFDPKYNWVSGSEIRASDDSDGWNSGLPGDRRLTACG
ncbi:hypothetical protein Hanom_Chr00s000006g01613351 [Helianthus anomalus]